jgi:N-acetylmuramoyl-L-alanine amidase
MTVYTELADVLRAAGLTVIEVSGWRNRSHGEMGTIGTIVCHHTATAASAPGDYPSLGIVRDGRADLPGPLAQLGLGRSGTWYAIAAGKCWHAGTTFELAQANTYSIGIEAEADGKSVWPEVQMASYARGCKALIEHFGLGVARVQGHKEIASPLGRKPDPNFDMVAFRTRVAAVQLTQGVVDVLDATDKAFLQSVLDAAVQKVTDQLGGDKSYYRVHHVGEDPKNLASPRRALEEIWGRVDEIKAAVSKPAGEVTVDVASLAAALAPLIAASLPGSLTVVDVEAAVTKALNNVRLISP